MASDHAAPPLPQPRPASAAARTLNDTAQAAASAWMNALEPTAHSRAVRHLCFALRDVGLGTWGLAYYQTTDTGAPSSVMTDFLQQVTAASESMLIAFGRLEDVLPAEPLSLPDSSDPGTALCQAARQAIRSWRRPTGTTADREQVIRQLKAATEALAQGARGLSFQAQDPYGDRLVTVCSYLSQATSSLTSTLQDPAADPNLPNPANVRPEAHGGDQPLDDGDRT